MADRKRTPIHIFAARLCAVRNERGMTQQQVAKRRNPAKCSTMHPIAANPLRRSGLSAPEDCMKLH